MGLSFPWALWHGGVSAEEPGGVPTSPATFLGPSSPQARMEAGAGLEEEDEIRGVGGGQPHLGLRDAGCHGHPVYATRPGGGGQAGGAASAPGRPRTAAAPARRRLSRCGLRGCGAGALLRAGSGGGGEPSRSVPVPVLSPDTARQHGPGEPGVPGGTGGYPGGLLRAVAAPGKFGKLGARSPEWGLGEDTASLVGFW